MAKNIFKYLETEKQVPKQTKEELMAHIKAVEKGKQPAQFFNTKFYGALVNFFKLRRPQ